MNYGLIHLVWPAFDRVLALVEPASWIACLGGGTVWEGVSKNRYEHIHVRLAAAILGRRHFWTRPPRRFSKATS